MIYFILYFRSEILLKNMNDFLYICQPEFGIGTASLDATLVSKPCYYFLYGFAT